jgi:hypothetical protein
MNFKRSNRLEKGRVRYRIRCCRAVIVFVGVCGNEDHQTENGCEKTKNAGNNFASKQRKSKTRRSSLIAKRTPERLTERLHAAQSALGTAIRFMWKVNLKPSELEELTNKTERLKFELESVEAEFADSVNSVR